jgi:hypothetical protein
MYTKLAALAAGAAALALTSLTAHALPGGQVAAGRGDGITLVEAHCGIGWWRGPEGHCHPDRDRLVVEPAPVVAPVAPIVGAPVVVEEPHRLCPLGMHVGPHGHDCFRDR